MYKVLIVDDEAPARELLKLKIDWASINCQVIGTAKNGQEGLIAYKNLEPDLIITDIQMPVMDGLTFIEKINAIDPDQPIIILSCHESFDFAKRAMKMGINDYLIKDSFETDELYVIISSIFQASNESTTISTQSSRNPELHSNIVNQFIVNPENHDPMAYVLNHQLRLEQGPYFVLFFDIELLDQDITSTNSHLLTPYERNQLFHHMDAIVQDDYTGELAHLDGNQFYAIVCCHNTRSEGDMRHEAIALSNRMRNQINSMYHIQSTIGISLPFTSLDGLEKAYSQSKEATERKIIGGYDKSYLYNQQNRFEDSQYTKILNIKLERISKALEEKAFDPMIKEIKDIFLQNLKGFMQYNYLKYTNWTLLGMLIDYCAKEQISYKKICDSPSPWEDILALKTVDDMCHWHLKSFLKIKEMVSVPISNDYSYHTQKIVDHIMAHYKEAISLQDLATQFDMSNAYLSRLFKKETGQSMTDFVNNVRIEEAKKLLDESTMKMYEIAEQTGFSSNQRFFSTFKKFMGISPGEYRKS